MNPKVIKAVLLSSTPFIRTYNTIAISKRINQPKCPSVITLTY
jgi:hypothetical protein